MNDHEGIFFQFSKIHYRYLGTIHARIRKTLLSFTKIKKGNTLLNKFQKHAWHRFRPKAWLNNFTIYKYSVKVLRAYQHEAQRREARGRGRGHERRAFIHPSALAGCFVQTEMKMKIYFPRDATRGMGNAACLKLPKAEAPAKHLKLKKKKVHITGKRKRNKTLADGLYWIKSLTIGEETVIFAE